MYTVTSPGQTAPRPTPAPRSLEVLVQHVRAGTLCLHCGAAPGKPCRRQGRGGVHLSRLVHAYAGHKITPREIAIVIGDLDAFTAATVIRVGGSA